MGATTTTRNRKRGDTRGENPGVAGSIPALATRRNPRRRPPDGAAGCGVSGGGKRMANIRLRHSSQSYGAMVAKRLRELRDSHGWSIDDFRNKLAEYGVTKNGELIPQATAYSYEQGKENKGANLPVDMYPVIAAIYGYRTPFGWLPQDFPDGGGQKWAS